ncbi:MAG TPA: ferritin-like protein, partial [Chitinophagaceae bacterium]|nr:ferritin-like protein [Chitinophagaceae bacterium]
MLEEMLHLTLAANMLNAVGGHPDLIHPKFVSRYPAKLPHSGGHFLIHIERFSKKALVTFMKIERPEEKGAKPQAGEFKTIDQFYAAVGQLLDELCDQYGEEMVFTGDKKLQIQPEDYYGSGDLVVVTDRDSAHRAISTIVDQGEGAAHGIFDDDHRIFGDGGGKELAHYYRFSEIYEGRHYKKHDTPKSKPSGDPLPVDYKAVYPIKADIDRRKFPKGSEIRKALDEFADCYGELLSALNYAFNNDRSKMTEAMARMFSLRNQAVALMRTPLGKGGENLGLDFTQQL